MVAFLPPSNSPLPNPLPHSYRYLPTRSNSIHRRKTPWRLSAPQKARQRKRLRLVDAVVATVDSSLRKLGQSTKAVERWKEEMPREDQMLPRDKYTIFDRKEKKYRKGIHSEAFLSFVFEGVGRV